MSVRRTVGAGDAMMAALAYGGVRQLEPADALRLATAFGTAVVVTGERCPSRASIDEILAQTQIETLAAARAQGDRGVQGEARDLSWISP